MTAYLIKSILCLLVLWGFYKIALEQTAAHQFKRFYLLGCLFIALTLPLLTLSYTVEIAPQPSLAETTVFEPAAFTENTAKHIEEPTNWIPVVLVSIYAAGVLLFGFRFMQNLYRIREKITGNEQVKTPSHVNVLLDGKVIPHSFLKYIFLPKIDFKNNTIAPEILQHEEAHVNQKHSWDILLIEFLQVVFWFNPLLLLLKKSIMLNHEFLADQAALSQNKNVENYTNLLFTYSGGTDHTVLSSPINYSLTKKRILMLSKTHSVKKLTTRLAFFVPILALCVYFFNQKIEAKPVANSSQLPTLLKEIATDSLENDVDLIEVKNDQIFINGNLILLEAFDTYLKDNYGEIDKESLNNTVFINIQTYPDVNQGIVDQLVYKLNNFGYNKWVWSASEFGHKLTDLKQSELTSSVVSGEITGNEPEFQDNPSDFVEHMKEDNTVFFYESKKVSAEKAEALLKRKQGENGVRYFVHTRLPNGDPDRALMVQINDY